MEGEERERDITGVYPQSLQDPKMGGSRLAKMADEEEELGTSGHEVEQTNHGSCSRRDLAKIKK